MNETSTKYPHVDCPGCGHKHYDWGIGVCTKGSSGPCKCPHWVSKEPEFFAPGAKFTLNEDDVYCPTCKHAHFGHGLGICRKDDDDDGCKCVWKFSKDPDHFTKDPDVIEFLCTLPKDMSSLTITMYITPVKSARPRTQKARGMRGVSQLIQVLQRELGYAGLREKPVYLSKIEKLLKDVDDKALSIQLRSRFGDARPFARPCPKRPRHGFVDSRLLELNKEIIDTPAYGAPLKELAREVYAHDKRGEILLMPFIDGPLSAIYANGVVTAGEGNDGATSGHNVMTFPVANVWPESFNPAWWTKYGVVNSPFLEIVYEKGGADIPYSRRREPSFSTKCLTLQPTLVQLRDGPVMDGAGLSRDYIPQETRITNVINPHLLEMQRGRNTLIAFEKAIEEAAPGTIVMHPGGAISSHYGIHCVMHKIPYITSKELCGWIDAWQMNGASQPFTLPASNGDVTVSKGDPDLSQWTRGFQAGLRTECLPAAGDMIQATLHFLHSSAAIDFSDPVTSYVFAFALAQTLKLAMLAVIGELRHGTVDLDEQNVSHEKTNKVGREVIYTQGDKLPPELLIRNALEMGKVFGFHGWNGAIGGLNWHLCAIELARAWNAVVDYMRGDGPFEAVLLGINNVVHASHNGAKMLTKFSSLSMMDLAAKCPPIMGLVTMPILWTLAHNMVDVDVPVRLFHGPSAEEVKEALVTDTLRRALSDVVMWEKEASK